MQKVHKILIVIYYLPLQDDKKNPNVFDSVSDIVSSKIVFDSVIMILIAVK